MLLLSNPALDGMVCALEDVLVDNPDDLFSHRSYADVLIHQRDPASAARGRLIEAQLKLEGALPEEERKKLERKARKFLKDHGRSWLGALAPFLLDGQGLPERAAYRFDFRRGWLDSVTAPCLDGDFARALAGAPQARLLRRLTIEDPRPGGPEALAALADAPFLAHLRALTLGKPGHRHPAPEVGAPLIELVAHMPRLEELVVLVPGCARRVRGLDGVARLRTLQLLEEDLAEAP
jgi:hypothetical protein